MFQILKAEKMIDFMRWSVLLCILYLDDCVLLFTPTTKSLNQIDFTGGTLIEVGFEEPANLPDIRSALEAEGFGDATVQNLVLRGEVMAFVYTTVLRAKRLVTKSCLRLKMVLVSKLRCCIEFVGPNVDDQ